MIQIYYASTDIITKIESRIGGMISGLSSKARSKMQGFKRVEDKYLMLTSLFLLSKILGENGFHDCDLRDLKYDNFGRPFFPGSPFDFNISHTGDIAAVVFSENCRVGIDIESIKEVDFSDFQIMFSRTEWNKIDSSENKNLTFFHYWTLLESAVKADGRGLSLIFSNITEIRGDQVIIEGKRWFSRHKDIDPAIVCCVSSDKENEETEFRRIL